MQEADLPSRWKEGSGVLHILAQAFLSRGLKKKRFVKQGTENPPHHITYLNRNLSLPLWAAGVSSFSGTRRLQQPIFSSSGFAGFSSSKAKSKSVSAEEMSARYMNFSPSATHSPQLPGMRSASIAIAEHDKYLTELLAERQKLSPFMQVLPQCCRLLNQEIVRVTALLGNSSFLDHNGPEHGSPLTHGGLLSNGGVDMNGWAAYQSERLSMLQASPHGWHGAPGGGSSGIIVKKTIRVEVPVDKYPNFNFVGRLLGPRGNSLKRVEAATECRVLIRGRGSIKDPSREDMMRDKPGYEHLNEPLHILVEAELPASIIDARLLQAREILEELLKPVDESQDFFKKQQLRELAILNGTLREDGSSMAGSVSPFNSSNLGMKRAKTRG